MENPAHILIIDDKMEDREALQGVLANLPYELHFAKSGVEGMVRASTIHPDVILVETSLPYLDGYNVCSLIRSHYALGETPVLLMSRQGDADARIAGLKAGADDFILKPFNRLELVGRLQGVIRLNRYRLILEQHRRSDELMEDSRVLYDRDVQGWSRFLDMRDTETDGHTQRVTELTLVLGRAVGLDEDAMRNLWRGAQLHDIGMLGIPDTITKKPGRLNEEEWKVLQEHPLHAYRWFSAIEFLRPALDIPYCHHEKWDGSGYPRGLKGEEIPLSARIFAIVDTWDALTTDRPYRRAMPAEDARRFIEEQAGRQFDPQIVQTFIAEITAK